MSDTVRFKGIIKDNKKGMLVFSVFCASLFLKNVLFKVFVDNIIPFSWFIHYPIRSCLYYVPLILPAVVISSFVFVSKRYHWTWIFHLILDLWIISNLLYSRAYNTLLTVDGIMMADNMKGTWDSTFTYWRNIYVVFPIISIAYSVFLYFIREWSSRRSFLCLGIILLVSWIMSFHRWVDDKYIDKHRDVISVINEKDLPAIATLNPFFFCLDYINCVENHPLYSLQDFIVTRYSIITYSIQSVCENIHLNNKLRHLIPVDEKEIRPFVNKDDDNIIAKQKLIIILVESLESWVVDVSPILGETICPNIRGFIQNNKHVVYFPHVKAQTRYGNSGDGQLIVMSGLLPIQEGVACMMFGNNTYPSIAKLYDEPAIINPSRHIWNQDAMSVSYGFHNIIEPEVGEWDDRDVMANLIRFFDKYDFILAITISTHVPFPKGEIGLFEKDSDIPESMRKYMNSFHYADSCIGMFLDEMDSNSQLQDYTVVITGDHTLLKGTMRDELTPWIRKYDLEIPQYEAFVPLVIYSSDLQNRVINDTVYQMDIYPTILKLTGCENYYWKGFGVNILNDSLRSNRPISEADAYRLSNNIILNNYFCGKIQ